MGVTTTLINKPLNPRAQDQSPLAYNRAALYSGKALSFDGVNDYVDLDGFTMAGDKGTFCFYADVDNDAYVFDMSPNRLVFLHNETSGQGIRVFNSTGWSNYGLVDRVGVLFYTIVCDGTSQSVFVNGQQVGDTQTIGSALNISSATKVKLGSNYINTGTYLNGQIAGFKIFNTALTAAQIADLYNNPEKIVPTGVDNTALKLWLPMMEGAGTTAFNGAPDALGSELITNGDFSDGTNNWTATNAVISAANNQITVDDNTNLGSDSRATQTFITEVGKKYRLVFTKVSTTSDFYLGVGGGSSYNNIVYLLIGANTGIYTIEFTATSTTTTLALITGGTGISVFANVSIKEQSGFGTISGATWTNGIGAPIAQTSVIDWNKASDGTNEVLLPAGLTTGRDITGVNLFKNVRKQSALNLDGQSWAEVHDNASVDLTTGATLECWYKWGTQLNAGLLGRWDYPNNQRSIALVHGNLDVARLLFCFDGSNAAAVEGTSTPAEGTWVHIAGTYDGTTFRLYVNATQEGFNSSTGVLFNSPDSVEIGRHGYGVLDEINGSIAQPRIYNRALTAEEVQRNYNAGKNIYS